MVKRRRRHRLGAGDIIFLTLNAIALTVFLLVMIYPFIYTVSTSFSNSRRLVAEGSPVLLPRGFSTVAYEVLLEVDKIKRFYLNTIIYAVGGSVFNLLICVLTAYPLTLHNMPGRRLVMIFLTITMFFSGGLVAWFIWLRRIGMANNVWAMIIPYGLNVWNIIIFKTFFQQLPLELSESAYLDGANDARILYNIILPLSKPIIATFAIFNLVNIWNDWFHPMLFLEKEQLKPMQLYLRVMLINLDTSTIQRSSGGSWTGFIKDLIDARPVRAAAVVITVVPIACVYPFFQKYFTKGILVGSLKG